MKTSMRRASIAVIVAMGCYAPPAAPASTALISAIELRRVQDGWAMQPDYTVVLRADGSAHYVGRWGVPMLGPYSARIDSAAFRKLAEHAIRVGFFAMNDEYTAGVTDASTTITTITAGNRVKRVSNYAYSGPAELRTLEDAVVLAAARLAWRSDASTDGQ